MRVDKYNRMSMRCPKFRNCNLSPNTLSSLRDAFKKKIVTNVTFEEGMEGMGGLAGQNVTLYKVYFKIHFKPS